MVIKDKNEIKDLLEIVDTLYLCTQHFSERHFIPDKILPCEEFDPKDHRNRIAIYRISSYEVLANYTKAINEKDVEKVIRNEFSFAIDQDFLGLGSLGVGFVEGEKPSEEYIYSHAELEEINTELGYILQAYNPTIYGEKNKHIYNLVAQVKLARYLIGKLFFKGSHPFKEEESRAILTTMVDNYPILTRRMLEKVKDAYKQINIIFDSYRESYGESGSPLQIRLQYKNEKK